VNSKIPGKIITFYSYKGGTGRSMALANTAWILASSGKRVLMVDWDIEAPGLHRYFHPFLQDKNLASSSGILDLMMNFQAAAIQPRPPGPEGAPNDADNPDWYLPLAEIDKYVLPLAWTFPQAGTLDLLPAGRQDASYAARANSFDWARFYDKFGGGVFLEAVKLNMRKQYNYILVDSRTGVSDVGGVCTVQLPDSLVVCFTFNIQSIEGSAAVADVVRKQRRQFDLSQERTFRLFPVPMRVEYVEKERLEASRELARKTLSTFLDHIPEAIRDQYWGRVEVPYVPFYAFEEILATIADSPGLTNSMLASFERLTGYLTDGETTVSGRMTEEERLRLRGLYISRVGGEKVTSAVVRRPDLQSLADRTTTLSKAWLETNRNQDYLLTQTLTAQLTDSADLLVPLLQNHDFREFWDASQQNIQRRHFRRSLFIDLGLMVVFAGLVVLSLWADRIWPSVTRDLSSGLINQFAAISSGLLGTAFSFLTRDTESFVNDRFSTRRISSLVAELINGLVVAVSLTIFLEDGSLGVKVTAPMLIAIVALAGYFARGLTSAFLQKLVVKVEPVREAPPKH
jgi:MinD-like ATPase involved in chromosome partitioning or flagellar assembly